jgi:hypothetical protein
MVTSPELTGNAGATYEGRVTTLYLVELLAGGGILGLEAASAKRSP